MSYAALLIELTALAGLLTAGYGLSLYLRERRAARQGETCAGVQHAPHGRLFGVPNTLVGIVYYLAVMAAFLLPAGWPGQAARAAVAAASLAAAGVSIFLLWSLMALTRRPCRVCLAGNAINLFLAGLIVADALVD